MRNSNILVGRLSKDPQVKKTNSGLSYLQFTLIVERDRKKDGKKVADPIPCVAWRKTAELMGDFLKKGSLIDVSGKLQTRMYKKDNQRHFVVEVIVDDFHILEPRSVTDQRAANRMKQEKAPYEQETGTYDPYGMSEELLEINDEDVPF